MTSPDAVFGPGLLWGSHGCPDCKAGPGLKCDDECPRRRRCRTCLDEGYIEVEGCTCEESPSHEPGCGVILCPEGCQEVRLDQH